MTYSREDIVREIDAMLEALWSDFVSEEELARREKTLKSDAALDCFEFLFNRLPQKKEQIKFGIAAEHSIDDLGLSARTYNALARNKDIRTVADLHSYSTSELLRIRMLGVKGIAEIQEKLERFKQEHVVEA